MVYALSFPSHWLLPWGHGFVATETGFQPLQSNSGIHCTYSLRSLFRYREYVLEDDDDLSVGAFFKFWNVSKLGSLKQQLYTVHGLPTPRN